MKHAIAHIIYICIIAFLLWLNFGKPPENVEPLIIEVERLIEVKAEVEPKQEEKIKGIKETISNRPITENADTLNAHIDTLEMQVMELIDITQHLNSINDSIILNQQEIILIQSECCQTAEKLRKQRKILLYTTAILSGVVIILTLK